MDSPHQHNTQEGDDQVKTNGASSGNAVGFRPAHAGVIKVQPPRREDLQPSYAQTLQGDEETNHGWYGGMSESCHSLQRVAAILTSHSQHPRLMHWFLGIRSMLRNLPESIQACQPGQRRSRHQVRPLHSSYRPRSSLHQPSV